VVVSGQELCIWQQPAFPQRHRQIGRRFAVPKTALAVLHASRRPDQPHVFLEEV
jgi:hypothetical protein